MLDSIMLKDRALYMFLALTFVGLLVDIRWEHRDVLAETWESTIPLYTAMVAVVTTFFAMSKKPKLHIVAAVLYLLIACVGILGVWEHTKFQAFYFTRYITLESKQPNGRQFERPSFAPMAFTLLGSIGFVLVSRKFRWPAGDESPEN